VTTTAPRPSIRPAALENSLVIVTLFFKGDLPAGDTDLTFEAGDIHGQDMFAGWKLLELPFPIQRQVAPLGLGEELAVDKEQNLELIRQQPGLVLLRDIDTHSDSSLYPRHSIGLREIRKGQLDSRDTGPSGRDQEIGTEALLGVRNTGAFQFP